jgi:hypothetical protein
MRVREPARDARATVHGQMRTGFRLDEMQRTVVEILQARPMPYREQRRPAQLSLEDAYHRFQIVVIERGRRLPALIPYHEKGSGKPQKTVHKSHFGRSGRGWVVHHEQIRCKNSVPITPETGRAFDGLPAAWLI